MVLDASLLNSQQYKVRIKGKVEQSRGRVAPSIHLGVEAIENRGFYSPSTTVANFTFIRFTREICSFLKSDITDTI